MLFKHAPSAVTYTFDDPNLVSDAGLVPVMGLAQAAGLAQLAQNKLTVWRTGADKGANPGAKISSLVAGMAAGADSINDIDRLRHGGMKNLFDAVYAPSTLGSHLREYTHGHVKQLSAVSSGFLANLGAGAPLLPVPRTGDGAGMVFVDIDDTVIEVHSAKKQGAGYGYNNTRGLNGLLVTACTTESAPVIIGQQLRKGSAHSARGAHKVLADALGALKRVPGQEANVVVRADSAYYSSKIVAAARRAGAEISVTVRLDKKIKKTIAAIDEAAWQRIEYKNAIYDESTGTWVSEAEVAEIPFTAFSSKKEHQQVTGRLVVRRVPEKNTQKLAAGQETIFEVYRHHGFFTTIDTEALDTAAADRMHRGHAVIEQVNAELKAGPLAHMPSGKFQTNAAWLVAAVITHNLIRAAATRLGGALARSRAMTIRARIINIAARIAHRSRKLVLHLPAEWKWAHPFDRLWHAALGPPPPLPRS